jgi:thiosulfate/3-mercaptopyruvate sulfurtransferase
MLPLIEANELKAANDDLIIIDARGGKDSRDRYQAGHLNKAIYVDLDNDLAAHTDNPAIGGRHPLPAVEDFTAFLGRLGVKPESHVVIYDDKSGAMSAARLWWMLRSIGHQKVQVLNGGLQAAKEAGIPVTTEPFTPQPTKPYPYTGEWTGTVDIEEAGQAAQNQQRMVIDVRENARYLGKTEPLDLIAGHIPGAENLPYTENLTAEGKYKQPEELKAHYLNKFGRINPDAVIVHCGSGVTACHTLLGMEQAGIKGPKLYVGSWSEWSRRDLPIATENK